MAIAVSGNSTLAPAKVTRSDGTGKAKKDGGSMDFQPRSRHCPPALDTALFCILDTRGLHKYQDAVVVWVKTTSRFCPVRAAILRLSFIRFRYPWRRNHRRLSPLIPHRIMPPPPHHHSSIQHRTILYHTTPHHTTPVQQTPPFQTHQPRPPYPHPLLRLGFPSHLSPQHTRSPPETPPLIHP